MAWGDHRTFVELHAKDRKAETPMATVNHGKSLGKILKKYGGLGKTVGT